MKVATGLERLISDNKLQEDIKGNIGLLIHSASITSDFEIAFLPLKKIFKNRIKKIFGPQHGFLTTAQDNMIESKDFIHPYFKTIVHSLYSEVRKPTEEMLEGLDTVIIDLQDVGTRIYTYIYTMSLFMEACTKKDIKIIVLDRPNPAGGLQVEGNILKENYKSFVGLYPLPVRHGMTIGEVAKWVQKYCHIRCNLSIISMLNWKRDYFFIDTGLPWVLPSPNLSHSDSALTFPGTVLFEGSSVSEGRGTTRPLEMIGHPKLEPYSFLEKIDTEFKKLELYGFKLRPISFTPTFNKHQNQDCQGFQIHVTDPKCFNSWRLGQFLMQKLFHELKDFFHWKKPPYEYEYHKQPIDMINGTDQIRKWVESNGPWDRLLEIEGEGLEEFLNQRSNILLY